MDIRSILRDQNIQQKDIDDALYNSAEFLVKIQETHVIESKIESLRKVIAECNIASAAYGNQDVLRKETADAKRRFAKRDLEYWMRRLKWAKRRDELSAGRPPGCWCLGLGGRDKRYITSDQATFVEYCSCPDGVNAELQAKTIAKQYKEYLIRYEQEANIGRIWGGAGIPERYRDFSIDTFPQSPENHNAIKAIKRWIDGDRWLYLHGDYGIGKTGLAIGILRELAARGNSVLFQTVPELLDRIRATYSQSGDLREGASESEVMESIKNVDVLVLDDLGTENVRPWVIEKMFIIINHRYNRNLRTIITSNIDLDQLADRIGDRIAWRIAESSVVYKLKGPNLRER